MNKNKLVFISIVTIISIILFGYYLEQNAFDVKFDETHYQFLGDKISTNGLLEYRSGFRTYLYPAFISFFNLISGDNFVLENPDQRKGVDYLTSPNKKLFTSIFQYIVYLGTIVYLANFAKSKNQNLIWYSVIGFGFLNPYLIQATTLFSPDILSACFIVISIIHFLNSDLSKIKNYSFAATLFFAAMMLRPSSSIFLPIIIIIIIFRFLKYRNFNIFKITLICLGIAVVIIFPQLNNNITNYDDWTPLIHNDLYHRQTVAAADYLKYRAVFMEGEAPRLEYVSPTSSPDNSTMFDLLATNPSSFSFVFISHIFAVIDWGYVDSYITDFYPASRILGSIFLYSAWFFMFYGVWSFFRKKIPHEKPRFIFYFLIVSVVLHMSFVGTIAAESRFGYPIFLLLLPFSGFGIQRFVQNTITHENKKVKLLNKILFSTILVSVILLFFYLSFLFDLQTQRIDWFTFIEGILIEIEW